MFRDGAADRSLHEEAFRSSRVFSRLGAKGMLVPSSPWFLQAFMHKFFCSPFLLMSFRIFPCPLFLFPFSPPPLSPQGCQKMSGRKYAKTLRLLHQQTEGGERMEEVTFGNGAFLCLPFSPHSSIFFFWREKKEEPPPSGKRFAEFLPCFVYRIKVTLIRHKLWYLECLFSQKTCQNIVNMVLSHLPFSRGMRRR